MSHTIVLNDEEYGELVEALSGRINFSKDRIDDADVIEAIVNGKIPADYWQQRIDALTALLEKVKIA